MKKHSIRWGRMALALLLAGTMGAGVATAQGQGKSGDFEGPGGMSAPSPEKKGGRGGRGGRGEMRAHRQDVLEQLNLSDKQKEQIKTLRQAQERRMIPLRASMEEAQLDLRDAMSADQPSKAKIDAAIDRLSDLRANAQKERVGSMLEMRNLLTADQRKKLKDLGGMGFGRMGGRGGHGFRMGSSSRSTGTPGEEANSSVRI